MISKVVINDEHVKKKGGSGNKKRKSDDEDEKFPGKGYTLGSSSGSKKKKSKKSNTKKKQKKITDYKMKNYDNNDCAVCLEPLIGNLENYCGRHQYHRECYQQLIDKNIDRCPSCRGQGTDETQARLREQHGDPSYHDTLISSDSSDGEGNINSFECSLCGNEEYGDENQGPERWMLDHEGQWICYNCRDTHWVCHNCDIVGPETFDDFRTDVMQYDGPEDNQHAYASAFGMQNRWGRWNDTTEHFSLNYNSQPESLCPECNYKAKWEDCGRSLKYEIGLDVIDNKECLKRRRTRRWQVVMEGKPEEQIENERRNQEEVDGGRWVDLIWYSMTCPKCTSLIWEDDPYNNDMDGNHVQMATNGKGQPIRAPSRWHGGFGFRDGAWQMRLNPSSPLLMNNTEYPPSGPDPNPNQGGVVESKE